MSNIFFFTDPTDLNSQNSVDAFGPLDNNVFNLDSGHSGNNCKAISIVGGSVFAQYEGVDHINMVLIPNQNELDEFTESTIDYIVYRGIKRLSIVGANSGAEPNKILPPKTNDVTKQIWEIFNSPKPELESYPSHKMLGLDIDTNTISNQDPIFKFITHSSSFRPIIVKAGDILGEFDTNFRIEVCLKRFDM